MRAIARQSAGYETLSLGPFPAKTVGGRKIMLRLVVSGICILIVLGCARAQVGGCCGVGPAPITGAPLLEIRGTITEVRISPGRGMPSLVVKHDSEESVLFLGSMRYLMAQDFNPKVGDEVVAKAYKTSTGLLAVSVTLPQTKKTIRLRDDSGRPLWRGPRW